MQVMPVDHLTPDLLEKVNMVMYQGIADLLADTPLPVYYTGCMLRGLGILRVMWKASLQDLNIYQTLSHINDTHLKMARNLEKEIIDCRKRLNGPEATMHVPYDQN